jgi:hypothetical protein
MMMTRMMMMIMMMMMMMRRRSKTSNPYIPIMLAISIPISPLMLIKQS